MTILVTGSNGFIGKQLVVSLIEAGYTVVGIDKNDSSISNESYIHYKIDLSNRYELECVFKSQTIDRIIHLAALAHNRDGTKYTWSDYYSINVENAKALFELSSSIPVLFISTVDVYGFYEGQTPKNANSVIRPISKYGKSKAMAEAECSKLTQYTIFRLSPVYSEENKRDIQKRYYLKYPSLAYIIGQGSSFEILNINNAIAAMINWCDNEPINGIQIIKDPQNMWTPDYIIAEKQVGRATFVIHFPKVLVTLGYVFIKRILGDNELTYLISKAIYPLRTE